MMTQTRPTELHQRRILMTRKPAAASEARSQVRAVIRAWEIPVDPDIAVLLTSDLVTHAIIHWDSATITLAVRCSRDQLRVDVYDTSLPLPMAVDEQAMTETRPGLALLASLATEWGSFLTFTGKAMYFALAFQADWLRIEDKTPSTEVWWRGKVRSTTLSSRRERPGSGSHWIKSSLSYANGNCVEVASLPGGEIGVRNSRNSAGPVLRFTSDEWHAFLGGVRNGEFDGFGR
jgi:hypothetical protein